MSENKVHPGVQKAGRWFVYTLLGSIAASSVLGVIALADLVF